jgi:hypothetical protein
MVGTSPTMTKKGVLIGRVLSPWGCRGMTVRLR